MERDRKMVTSRMEWNAGQKKLRTLLSASNSYSQAIQLFLKQHAEVHSSIMSSSGTFSFEDEVLVDLTDVQMRKMPDRMDHSIAWIIWHLARIEDVTMNILVAGTEQLFSRDDWKYKLEISALHTGNAMPKSEITDLSKIINIDNLRNYRVAVGRQTEKIAKQLDPGELGQKVSPSRLDLLVQEGAVVKEAKGLIDYWSKRTVAGLLLMPPTRHCFIHLNEAVRIKKKIM